MQWNSGFIRPDAPLYEFDELTEETQEQCIEDFFKTSTAREVAIDDLRHMKFNVNGEIKRGYDEE